MGMVSAEDFLERLMQIEGAIAGALIDSGTGKVIASAGDRNKIESITQKGRSFFEQIEMFREIEQEEDFLAVFISLDHEYHFAFSKKSKLKNLFYFILDSQKTTFGIARNVVMELMSSM